MLPLLGQVPPASPEELIVALTGGLDRMFHLPAGQTIVDATGADYPALDRLHIDVTGASLKETYRPQLPAGPRQPGITTSQLEIVGRPVHYQQAALDFALEAQDAHFAFRSHAATGNQLDPITARQGRVQARMSQADLEVLLHSAFQAAAVQHGVLIEKTKLTLTGLDERSVAVHLRVTGSKRMAFVTIRAVFHGRGRLVIDEALQATLSGLSCEGEGIVGQMLVGMLQHQLHQWEGRSFPLTAFSLGELKLRDLKMECQGGLQVDAVLGR
jgi:hypothetical protein